MEGDKPSMPHSQEVRDRSEPKIDRSGGEDACHTWLASLKASGHGQFSVNGQPMGAYVVAWELENGRVPKGLCVLHTCDNACCVNTKHLYIGTKGDNARDMHSRGRWHYVPSGNGKGPKRTGGKRGPTPTPEADRFWPKVDKHDGDIDVCWEYQGTRDRFGYGTFWVYELRRKTYAHRVAYALHYGPFDKRLVVRHDCDNPICCNPHHLRLGTRADNNRDRAERGRGREARQWGASNPRSKLTAEMVLEIRTLAAAGVTQVAIAVKFNVKQPQISRLVRGVSWPDGPWPKEM